MEHDQLGEIGEIRSHSLEPFPDATDDGNNLRPGIVRVRDLREWVEIGLPGDCNQAVAAYDLTAKRSFARYRPFISAVHRDGLPRKDMARASVAMAKNTPRNRSVR